MALLVANCPRCSAKDITFDVIARAEIYAASAGLVPGMLDVFCVCKACRQSVVFTISPINDVHVDHVLKLSDALNNYFYILNVVRISPEDVAQAPEHLPAEIKAAFDEAATCLSVGCFNAAGTMFRLCLDLATKPLVSTTPKSHEPPLKHRQRRDLAPRLEWLFTTGRLPPELHDLAHCVREDGNDGAHAGTLTKADAEDLLDFTTELLISIFTRPARLKEAAARRVDRRKP
jgi:hypothetical protein